MNSCLYECRIFHGRFSPKPHRFFYRIFLFAIDLDELEALHRKLLLFSINRPNLYAFNERDFFPLHEASRSGKNACHVIRDKPHELKTRIVGYLAARGVDLAGGRVLLVTLPRVCGYLFNPVSFYFCYDRHGAPVASLAEVTNTFKEMKPYFLGPETRKAAGAEFQRRVQKFFYVSPYSDVDVAFDFTLRAPREKLSIQIDDYVGAERTLTSVLAGTRRELTGARLAWFTVKYPLITLQVIALIHWHAFRLWLKRVPWFPKAARPADQRGVRRPHVSPLPAKTPEIV